MEAPKSGIRFPVPEDWKSMSFREVIDSGDKEAIDEAAKSMGVTPEQLDTIADQIEVIVFGPTVKGFAVNINAVPQPNTAMPSAAEATSQLQQIGGKVGKAEEGTTSLGKSLVVPYTLKVQDRTVQGRTLLDRDRRRGRHPHRVARVGRRGRQADQVDPRQRRRALSSELSRRQRAVDLHRPDRLEAGGQQRPQARDVRR